MAVPPVAYATTCNQNLGKMRWKQAKQTKRQKASEAETATTHPSKKLANVVHGLLPAAVHVSRARLMAFTSFFHVLHNTIEYLVSVGDVSMPDGVKRVIRSIHQERKSPEISVIVIQAEFSAQMSKAIVLG